MNTDTVWLLLAQMRDYIESLEADEPDQERDELIAAYKALAETC